MLNNYKYRDSGIEWLGEVPEHWDVQKVKHVATYSVSNVDKKTQEGETPIRLFNYTDVYNNEYLTNDMELMAASASQGQIDNHVVHTDDVLITKDSEDWRDIAKPALVKSSAPDIVCGYHLALIRPSDSRADGKFIFRLLQSILINQQFQINSNGVTRYGLPKSAIGESLIVLPPNIEQRSIIQYLDRVTNRIDALIQKKERMIELLKEKRIALITQAVTKGLDPNVPMKDSGIEWLGEVPEHWEIKPLKTLIEFVNGAAFSPNDWSDEGTPIIRIENLNGSEIYNCFNDDVDERYHVKSGDLLFGWSGNKGTSFGPYIWNKDGKFYLNQHIFRIVTKQLDVRWLYWSLKAVTAHIEEQTHGIIGMVHVTKSEIGIVKIPYPPVMYHSFIASFIENETASIDQLVDKILVSISLLREYRASLIHHAVTGKIDLRGYDAQAQ